VSLSVRLIKDDFDNPDSLKDADGNIYQTVTIGAQIWLARGWQCTNLMMVQTFPILQDFMIGRTTHSPRIGPTTMI
jgi:hypothetical protein